MKDDPENGGPSDDSLSKAILDLHEAVPVVANSGVCMDRDGKIMPIEESPAKDLIDKYYFLEYNTLKQGSGYREEMFRLAGRDDQNE